MGNDLKEYLSNTPQSHCCSLQTKKKGIVYVQNCWANPTADLGRVEGYREAHLTFTEVRIM
jgi:hypothetical protein